MKYTEEQLTAMTKPASDYEESRMENALKMVKDALLNNDRFPNYEYEVFAQGSYANNTNIKNNSDIDINVCYTGAFYYDLPLGKSREEYGFTGNVEYSFFKFKDDVEAVLVKKFGRDQVVRKNKCIHIKGNTYRTDIDVVPTWIYRRYESPYNRNYVEGVKLFSDAGAAVVNFPKQHLANGRQHNTETRDRYKKLVRIVKRVYLNMEDDGYYANEHVTSFLLECLVYLLPVRIYDLWKSDYKWNDRLYEAITYWYNATKADSQSWKEWTEVSELLYLMTGHKWNRSDVNEFVLKMWNYLGYSA